MSFEAGRADFRIPSREELEAKYMLAGYEAVYSIDEPDKVYEPHSHHMVRLFSLNGSVKIKLDGGEWQEVQPGEEVVIEEGQVHEAVIGPDGWEYIYAYPEGFDTFPYKPAQS